MTLTLDSLLVGDDPASWAAAGFTVADDVVSVGGVRIVCCDDGGGADRWRWRSSMPLPDAVDGIVTEPAEEDPAAAVAHPNHVIGLDHVVLRSPDLDRTTEALVELGLDLRRVRDVGEGATAFQQRFFRADGAILELVGPVEVAGDDPATIWGYAFVVDDIDAAAATLGDRCAPPKEAVQPGRRIATVRTKELGIGVTVALMTPHVKPEAFSG